MSVGPGRDPLATKRSSYDAFAPAASDADNASDASAAFGAFMDVGNDEGGGWFYCAHHKRFVQLDPVFVCPSKADTGTVGVNRFPIWYGVPRHLSVDWPG